MRRALRAEALALLAVLALGLVGFAWQWDRPQARTGTADSYWYLTDAARYAGASPTEATARAGTVYCAELERAHRLGARPRGCVRYVAQGVSPRYRAIFDSRPGLPLAAAVPVAVLGLARGMAVTTAVFFVAVAAAGYAALRAGRVGRIGSVVGAASVSVLPIGYWDSRMLAEGAATAGVVATLLAAVLLLRRRSPGRVYALVAALTWIWVTKPAAAAALTVALVAAGSAALVVRRVRHGRWSPAGWLTLAGACAAVGVLWSLLARVLGLPSLTETVQDLATRHYRTPDIPDPLPYLVHRAGSLWWQVVLGVPWSLMLVGVACAFLVWRLRGVGLAWSAAALSGVLVVSAHPLRSEYPRLIATTWLAVAAALAVLTDLAVAWVRARRTS